MLMVYKRIKGIRLLRNPWKCLNFVGSFDIPYVQPIGLGSNLKGQVFISFEVMFDFYRLSFLSFIMKIEILFKVTFELNDNKSLPWFFLTHFFIKFMASKLFYEKLLGPFSRKISAQFSKSPCICTISLFFFYISPQLTKSIQHALWCR
jgi:hypothetical protein